MSLTLKIHVYCNLNSYSFLYQLNIHLISPNFGDSLNFLLNKLTAFGVVEVVVMWNPSGIMEPYNILAASDRMYSQYLAQTVAR